MIIHRNIKSRIKSRTLRSLPERSRKRHLSFYSSIERDIRDIEMRLYRIKKALKYYSEDGSENKSSALDKLNKVVDSLDDYKEGLGKIIRMSQKDTSEPSYNSRIKRYYSQDSIKDPELEKGIIQEYQKTIAAIIEEAPKNTEINRDTLIKHLENLINHFKQLELNSNQTIFSKLRAWGWGLFTLGSTSATLVHQKYGALISKLGPMYSTAQASGDQVTTFLGFFASCLAAVLGVGAIATYYTNQKQLKTKYLQARQKYIENLENILELLKSDQNIDENELEEIENAISESKENFEMILEKKKIDQNDLEKLEKVNSKLEKAINSILQQK